MTTNLKSRARSRRLGVLFAAAAMAVLPAVTLADSRGGGRDDRDHNRDHADYRNDQRDRDDRGNRDDRGDRHDNDRRDIQRIWVEPAYCTVTEQKWVPAEYRTVTDHVWHEPVVRNETERVWVPDKYETRPVDPFGHTVALKKVLVKCGHYEDVCRDVVIKPGYYEDVCRQELVCDGHYQTVERQELVTAGHWAEEDCTIASAGDSRVDHDRGEARISFRWPF